MFDEFVRDVTGVIEFLGDLPDLLKPAFLAAVWTATWMNLGSLFTVVTIGALTLPPHIPPQTPVDWLVLIVGGLFLTKIGLSIYNTYQKVI